MDARVADEVSITDLFDKFIEASTMRNVLSIYHRILNYSDLEPCEFNQFFPKLKRVVMTSRVRKNWKAKALFSKIDKKAAHKCYSGNRAPTPLGTRASDKVHDSINAYTSAYDNPDDSLSSQSNRIHCSNNVLQNYNCLVIGSGPAGLRTAIELQLLGASRVVVVEKRSRFSRNNVLHLWPFVIDDLKSLGAKKFYGKFCAGSIDHISIRQLQLILLKISLMIGCDFRDSCSYIDLCPATIKPPAKQTSALGAAAENNGDINEANSSSDSNIFAASGKCDLDADKSNSDNFVKVSDSLECATPTGGEAGESQTAPADSSETSETSSESNSKRISNTSNIDTDSTPSSVGKSDSGSAHKRAENLRGARAHFKCDHKAQEWELHSIDWDIIIGADGRRNTLSKFFPRKEFRGRLAIAITANFINRQTPAEASVSEISGLSFIYNQEMFNSLAYDTGIELENICYYKDDTHYFVMTAKKRSLLERGVLIRDFAATQDLLSDDNVDRQALLKYARDAAFWTTGLDPLDFALNHYGQEDCAMFDFTSMYAASNACKALRTRGGGFTLVGLVGDSLLEPFWPTGSGCARGFLSSFDAAWMCRQWAFNKCAVIDHHSLAPSRSSRSRNSMASETGGHNRSLEPSTYDRMALSVMAERESIYRILAQTTSENLQQNYSLWTLNPHSRYPNLNRHLVTPSQVEHLIADSELKSKLTAPQAERARRIKSPNNARKSPKKLKSACSSPQAQPKHARAARSKLGLPRTRPRSQHDLTLDPYQQLEASYADLDGDGGASRRAGCDLYDDYFVPSVSGTMPSANNLLSLEARRARDIDDCLRQRRQRTQLRVVRDQLVSQFRGSSVDTDRRDGSRTAPVVPTAGGAALFGELRRLREQRAANRENIPVDRPLKLLNSIRRCASFAERVKSFESRMGSAHAMPAASGQEVSTPKTPIDNVKNLPQFATLQELIVSNTKHDTESVSKNPKMPIMKLSKDDWNVKCWEKRLAAFNRAQKSNNRQTSGSSKSLNKAASVDSYTAFRNSRPDKQVEVFKDRIKEMAEKLTREHNQRADSVELPIAPSTAPVTKMNSRSQGWVSHLKQELIKGSEPKRPQQVARQAMNPSAPQKPIKKLFGDDEEDDNDNGIDINKHYDHLCINRPKNKYLSRNGYTSHMTRTRYDDPSSRVIELAQPTKESKQAYLNTLTSRGSSASSIISDQSSATTGESSSSAGERVSTVERVKCRRCNCLVGAANKITIVGYALHLSCLSCAVCGITLRTNEIQLYLSQMNDLTSPADSSDFTCAICRPNIRLVLAREAASKLEGSKSSATPSDFAQNRMQSREQFLTQQINYNELYKSILDEGMRNDDARQKIERLNSSNSRESTPNEAASSDTREGRKSRSTSLEYEDAKSSTDESHKQQQQLPPKEVSPSPIMVTLPLELVTAPGEPSAVNSAKSDYRIARSETIDGSEQVTLVLPSGDSPACEVKQSPIRERADSKSSCQREMIDEDELNRLLHLDSSSVSARERRKASEPEGERENDASEEHEDESSDDNDQLGARQDDVGRADDDSSDELSSLNSAQHSEDYDDDEDDGDDDDELDRNSTYEDFLTSEELGEHSDRDDNLTSGGPAGQSSSQCG